MCVDWWRWCVRFFPYRRRGLNPPPNFWSQLHMLIYGWLTRRTQSPVDCMRCVTPVWMFQANCAAMHWFACLHNEIHKTATKQSSRFVNMFKLQMSNEQEVITPKWKAGAMTRNRINPSAFPPTPVLCFRKRSPLWSWGYRGDSWYRVAAGTGKRVAA